MCKLLLAQADGGGPQPKNGLTLLEVALPTYTMVCLPGWLSPLTVMDLAAGTVAYLEMVKPLGKVRSACPAVRVITGWSPALRIQTRTTEPSQVTFRQFAQEESQHKNYSGPCVHLSSYAC